MVVLCYNHQIIFAAAPLITKDNEKKNCVKSIVKKIEPKFKMLLIDDEHIYRVFAF